MGFIANSATRLQSSKGESEALYEFLSGLELDTVTDDAAFSRHTQSVIPTPSLLPLSSPLVEMKLSLRSLGVKTASKVT